MQLLSLCLSAIVVATTAANAEEENMALVYRTPYANQTRKYASYNECIPVNLPGELHLELILFDETCECEHYGDAECKQKPTFSPRIEGPGPSSSFQKSGCKKCHSL